MPWYKKGTNEIVPDALATSSRPTPTPSAAATPASAPPDRGMQALSGVPTGREGKYPRFERFVRGALTAADPGLQPPPDWLTHIYAPQTTTQAVLYPLQFLPGLGESKMLDELVEQYPEAATVLKPAAALARATGKNWFRRMATSTGAGALTGAISGEGGRKGATEGFLLSGSGEALAAARPIARMIGKGNYLEGIQQAISETLGRHLPGVDTSPGELSDLTHGTMIVDEASKATSAERDAINQTAGRNKVTMPHIKGGADIRNPVPGRMKLEKAEKQLTKMADFGYGAGGSGKRNLTSRQARELLRDYRIVVQTELNIVQPGLGDRWVARRATLGKAQSMARMFKDGVIDEETGQINPTKWSLAVKKHWDDLVQHFGLDGAKELERAGGARKGIIPQPSETPHVGFRLHGGLPVPHAGLGRTLRPPNVPENILSYPPRAAFSLLGGIPMSRALMGQMFPQRVNPTVP